MNAFEQRGSAADAVERLLRSRTGEWFTASELARVGGFCAWRTRIADVRRRLKRAEAGTVEWNGDACCG